MLGILKSLGTSKAAGLDNIPPKLVKAAAEELAVPITTLANRSLTCGLFPNAEKAAKISPIYKSGDRAAIDNYRPISVLPVFSKVLKRPVYNWLSYYLETNQLLSDSQYGFRRKRSTQHAVTILMDDIRTGMDNLQLTGAVFLDLRKAFDTVNHARLLNKLPAYNHLTLNLKKGKTDFILYGTAKKLGK